MKAVAAKQESLYTIIPLSLWYACMYCLIKFLVSQLVLDCYFSGIFVLPDKRQPPPATVSMVAGGGDPS